MFADRRDAGRRLADRLARYSQDTPVIVGLPRGGVVVAAEVAERLGAPLDMIVVRKIGCPWQPELGLGAIAEGDIVVRNDALIREAQVTPEALDEVTAREQRELARRVVRYRQDRARYPLQGRAVILVDDGLATGYTARAAIESIRKFGARRVILAVPVASASTATSMRGVADEVVVLETPRWFSAIGEWYRDFAQTSDEDVISLIDQGGARTMQSDVGPL